MEKKAKEILLHFTAHIDGFSPYTVVSLCMVVNALLQKCPNENKLNSAEDSILMHIPLGRAVTVVSASTYSFRSSRNFLQRKLQIEEFTVL
jgi:hypothetical protein